ncbi:DNA-processing protein DprA [Syntrophorhabdus aromaticivorans]|nr:DNA-processing protein DprA [Syntrophorhabdus aromaticivorans]
MDEKLALIALQRLNGLGRATKKQLVEEFDTLGPLFAGKARALFGKDITGKLRAFNGWEDIDRDLMRLERMGVHVLTIKDEDYPLQLRTIPDAPVVLYKKGMLRCGPDTIAVVGSRRASFESRNIAEKIAQTLSSLGITVISGLARGIDTAAHKGALKEKGKSVGVLGCGIDITYPAENRWLFDKMAEEGTILTEYSPGERPLRHHFPERNRIIAGLSRGVLVVEASQRSGSLITARLALEYGREVMAIPGSIFDKGYKGANSLIKQGARLIDGIEDIIAACFPKIEIKRNKQVDLNDDESYIYSIIGFEKVHVDEVIDKSRMDTRRVMAILTSLEIKEAIRAIPGGFFLRK